MVKERTSRVKALEYNQLCWPIKNPPVSFFLLRYLLSAALFFLNSNYFVHATGVPAAVMNVGEKAKTPSLPNSFLLVTQAIEHPELYTGAV